MSQRNKSDDQVKTVSSPKLGRSRTQSKVKRPQRPARSASVKSVVGLKSSNDTTSNDNNTQTTTTTASENPTLPESIESPMSADAARGRFKFRGKGGKTDDDTQPKPWDHAHDEYVQRRADGRVGVKSPKRPPRGVRFGTTGDAELNIDVEDGRDFAEEKSNRPLAARTKRPKKRANKTYVNANSIHELEFRSAYRPKTLPPDPGRYRTQNGREQFGNMIEQLADMQGLDKSDFRVQQFIQSLNDKMSEVTGFDRFLQNRDDELAKMVQKQEKRRQQMGKINQKLNSSKSGKGDKSEIQTQSYHQRKGSVKNLVGKFEKQGTKGHSRRQRRVIKGREALRPPNIRMHRRRVSSQFNMNIATAFSDSQRSRAGASPLMVTDADGFPENDMDDSTEMPPSSNHLGLKPRQLSYNKRASFSHQSGQASILFSHHETGSVILGLGGNDDDMHSFATPSVMGDTDGGDPLHVLINILCLEPQERTEDHVDTLVDFFEHYQIMTEDVDAWSGKATFRSFIQQTRYRFVPQTKYIFREGDEGDEFYFVLRGSVSVLVDNSELVNTSHQQLNVNAPKKEIHTVFEHHVFGEMAMFNANKRSATCVAKTDVHLAYWDRSTYDEYIRPMKELKKKAKKLLYDKSGNMLSEDQLIEKAAMFLDDAMHGRELKMHRNGPWPRRIHKLINHKYFGYCLVMVSMLYLALIFIEPPSYRDSAADATNRYFYRIMPLIAFEWFVFFVFFFECILRFYSFGWRRFLSIDLHVMRVFLLTVLFLDLAITCAYNGDSFRFSRVLRPIFPLLFMRDLRRQYYIVVACVPHIIELVLLWLIIASIFARVAYHIFYYAEGDLVDNRRHSLYDQDAFAQGLYPYDEQMREYCQLAEADDTGTLLPCDQMLPDYIWDCFSTFFKALIALFVLLTTENFPDVWWPTWLSNDGSTFFWFFLVYILIAVFFLLNLFSAVVYHAYQNIIYRLDVVDEQRETQALKVAWICLDTGETGFIGYQKFESLLYRLKPEYTDFEVGVICKLLDPDNRKLIKAEDFSFMVINVLYLSISRKTTNKDEELKLYLQRIGSACPNCTHACVCINPYEVLTFFTSDSWKYILLIVQAVDILALLSYHMYPEICNMIDLVCSFVFLLALAMDFLLNYMASLKTYLKSTVNRLYFGLTLIQTVGSWTALIEGDRSWLSALRFFGILRVLIVGVFALTKIKYLRTSLTRTLTQTVIFMIPIFMRIVFHIVVVLMYMYMIVGMELFVSPDESSWGTDRCQSYLQVQNDPYALFCDAEMALVTLTQLITTNNWNAIMYQAMETTGNPVVALYFCTFFFIGPILAVSLLLAMFFNMFFGVAMQSEHALSAFFNETDQQAQMLQEHMDLQNFKQTLDTDADKNNVPLATEVGISTLPDGTKILTIKRPKFRDGETGDDADGGNGGGGEGDVHKKSTAAESNFEHETKAQEMELVHVPLETVTRKIWDHVPGEPWTDVESGAKYEGTFTGKDATEFMLRAGFASDAEDAVDYLTQIMDEIGAFMRVDSGKEAEFENNSDAHYQWIHVPEADDDDDAKEMDGNGKGVALDQIVVGFRHSYGGYQRLIKQYRMAGIDPQREAAMEAAQRVDPVPVTPMSDGGDKTLATKEDREKSTSPDDKVAKLTDHIRNKSSKLKDKIFKTDSAADLQQQANNNPYASTNSANSLMALQMREDNDDDEPVVSGQDENGAATSSTALPTTSLEAGHSSGKSQKLKLATIESDREAPVESGNKASAIKKRSSRRNVANDAQSAGLIALSKKYKPKMTKTQSNGDELDTVIKKQETTTTSIATMTKAKSGSKAAGLKRGASQKNILLRHLDQRPGGSK
eukprot:CAMPEP_0202692366 /NCGR_PEP_ID=MMETSP1385-20130828/6762_1 /ASSEMBLY_ACC=CAM_ASM_000861 /TAXON_ID=933848 /ORGANISM="Elphidium margaritaceum" /LENGTH=1838 /DNA_ID=CAMNT_0049347889 /DNA_START=84 /DNA_END=5600 /DNA_ORIENTATION=-